MSERLNLDTAPISDLKCMVYDLTLEAMEQQTTLQETTQYIQSLREAIQRRTERTSDA